jgi:DNA helicase-2/ATP-dependent DNA helicase PcrA
MPRLVLNPQQKEAVKHEGKPLLIIAGAGTGKTTVITERIKWLITKKNLLPSQILALTFTEKAASEMEERVDIALPLGYSQLWISTFHSFCDRILRDEAIHIGLNPDFKLLTEAEAILFIRKYLFQLKLDYFRPASNPTKFLKELLNHFSRLRDEDITPKQYLEFAKKQAKMADTLEEKEEARKTRELADAFIKYQELKDKEGLMDFADLISNTLRLFRERSNLLREYREKFQHILIDEFQDTNIAQYQLIKLLAPPASSNKLTVTGDDSQSIYKFRGAAVSNILTFMEDYKDAKMVVLTENYRSTQQILDRSYQLIRHNDPDTLEAKLKIPKNLKGSRKIEGEPVKLILTERVEEEAETVAGEIKKLTKKEKYQFKEIAILVRANNHAEPFTHALARQGIPYQFLGPGQLFRQPEIKDLIAYLQLLNDPYDDIAAFRVCNIAVFDLPARDLAFIRGFARRYNLSFLETLEKIAKGKATKKYPLPSITQKTKIKVKKLVSMIHRHLKLVPKESGGQILYYFLQDSRLLKQYLNPQSEKEQLAALNISKFFDKVKAFESQNKETSVADLVDWISLRMEMGESPLASEVDWSENNAVNILTVHSAKGLEFPVVFLVNLVDRRFPASRRAEVIPVPQPLIKEILPEGDPHEQEERRLFYVGMTRAKDRLYFTAAKFYGEGKLQKRVSPFVIESLGEEVVDQAAEEKTVERQQLMLLDWQKIEEPPERIVLNPPVTYLSFSQIDSYSICPLQYKYKYILRLPTPPSASQVFGDIIHKTLKTFYQKQLTEKRKLDLESLKKILEENWRSEGFTSKAHEKTNKRIALRMLRQFYHRGFNYHKIGNVLALEQPFSFRVAPTLKIGGIMDRVDNLEDDRIEIIDYKTGARTPSPKDVDRNQQLTFYALAASSIKDLPFYRPVERIVLSLYFLDSGIKLSSSRTSKQMEEAKEKVIKLAEEIEKSDFPPKPNRPFPCNYCEFRLLCDAWK